jgi:hypothetical protein
MSVVVIGISADLWPKGALVDLFKCNQLLVFVVCQENMGAHQVSDNTSFREAKSNFFQCQTRKMKKSHTGTILYLSQ